jgi:hypothetical protein
MKRRGRRRTLERTTAIGAPRMSSQITPYEKKAVFEKENMILSWLSLDKDLIARVRLRKALIDERDIPQQPDLVCNVIIDKHVNVDPVRYLFTPKAWQVVVKILEGKKASEDLPFFCGTCKSVLISSSVQCESCLIWLHQRCVPKFKRTDHWFCSDCKRAVMPKSNIS